MTTPATSDTKTIVLIHGLFLTHSSWDAWRAHYAQRGYNALAVAWPGLDRTVQELRADPTPLTKLDIQSVVDHLDRLVRDLPAPPIIIGHSFGGLFAQLLAYRGVGSAVVGLDPTAPAGVLDLPFSTLKASAPVLANPFNIGNATMLTPDQFHYAFTNTIGIEESRTLYDRYAVPCADRILFEGAFDSFLPHSPAHVDVELERPPILLIAGGADHLVTPGYTKANFNLIARSPSITAFREFPGRPHFTGVVAGWEAVADFALDWALTPTANEPVHSGA
jgi:pimeloyl-ACP methyl ester carboxylesterase